MQKYEAEREEKARAIPALEEKVRAGRENIEGVSQWMRHIRQYTRLEALNEGILIELVERIEVGEPHKVDGSGHATLFCG